MVKDTHTNIVVPREPVSDLHKYFAERRQKAEKELAKLTKEELAALILPYRGNGVLRG